MLRPVHAAVLSGRLTGNGAARGHTVVAIVARVRDARGKVRYLANEITGFITMTMDLAGQVAPKPATGPCFQVPLPAVDA